MRERSRWMVIVAAGLSMVSAAAFADDTEALAKAAQNPIANMIKNAIRKGRIEAQMER